MADKLFRVACVQNCAIDDLNFNLSDTEELIRAAAKEGADLICLPENVACLERQDTLYYERGYGEKEHPALIRYRDLASRLGIWILIGSLTIKLENGKVNNRGYLIDDGGDIVASYNKIHLFDVAIKDGQTYRESNAVAAGSEAVLAATPWGNLGLTICYDLRFPHLYRELAQRGADFLTIPAAFTAKTGAAHWHVLCRARAIETGCYVFAPGQFGQRPWGRRTYGHSLIIDPWGEVLADAGDDRGYIVAEIHREKVDEARRMIPALEHDRPFNFT